MSNNLTYSPVQKLTIKAGADLPAFRFIDYEGNLCGNNEKSLGLTDTNWLAGDNTSAITLGTAIIETAGAISVGALIASDADGRAKLNFGSDPINGRAITATSGAGFIKIMLIQ